VRAGCVEVAESGEVEAVGGGVGLKGVLEKHLGCAAGIDGLLGTVLGDGEFARTMFRRFSTCGSIRRCFRRRGRRMTTPILGHTGSPETKWNNEVEQHGKPFIFLLFLGEQSLCSAAADITQVGPYMVGVCR
jgi:hypothetical protein